MTTFDPVNHPPHYTKHPSGVECIQITEWYNFNIGNAIKYLWRAGHKHEDIEDYRKAIWYINREIERLQASRSTSSSPQKGPVSDAIQETP
jgi:predicted ATPase